MCGTTKAFTVFKIWAEWGLPYSKVSWLFPVISCSGVYNHIHLDDIKSGTEEIKQSNGTIHKPVSPAASALNFLPGNTLHILQRQKVYICDI